MPIRITGMTSGLDTESIVTALVSGHKAKKDKLVKAQTKQQWKMDAWKGVNTKVYDLYKSLDKMRLSTGGYKAKKTTVSDATKASVSASGSALNGTQTLKIKELASAGYLTGGTLDEDTKGSTKLSELGFTENGKITVKTASGSKDIEVNGDTTIDSFVSSLKDAGVNASYDAGNHRIFVSAKDSGAANDFSLTGANDNGVAALDALKLNTSSKAANAAYEGIAKYALNEEGESYYVLDAKGKPKTYVGDDGKTHYQTNGTYSEAKTRENLETVIASLQTNNEKLDRATTENAANNRKLGYVEATAANKAAVTDEQTKKKIDGLLSTDATYASIDENGVVTKYTDRVKNDNGSFTYTKEDGTTITSDDDYTVSDQLSTLAKDAGLITVSEGENGAEIEDETKWAEYKQNFNKISSFEKSIAADLEAGVEDAAEMESFMNEVKAASTDNLAAQKASIEGDIAANQTKIDEANTAIKANAEWDEPGIASKDAATLVETALGKVSMARQGLDTGGSNSEGAVRVDGKDAEIELNGAKYTSKSNKFEINGLTINATGKTAEGEEITITTASDTQATYDKIKDFLTQYNEVMSSLSSSYNADSAKGYEPLTDEEKEQMSDKEIEKWEAKVKDGLLRRDQTLSGIMTTISGNMSKSYSVTMADGSTKNLSLASLGISTGSYFTTSAKDRYAYHIDGDEDDDVSSSNADKLMKMIEEDPDAVESLMKQVTQGLYESLDAKMKSTTMSSAYTIYNDKEMGKEYSSYTKQIKTWEDRLSDLENKYYKQFAAMEKALTTLNGNSSALGNMMGG